MADLGTAYVQVVPSAQGIKSKLSGIFDSGMPAGGKSAGSLFSNGLISTVKKAFVTAGIGKALKEAVTEGADLQQSLGGVETLFKDSASTVIANAEMAYRTAGVSANSYMEQVTSFSASLLQSLGGDTARAADISNMAMVDMSDNVNKFGSDMQSITNAYQGFAKQNYTMLDNLKLGYGGTKSEMQRLLKDAQALTGVKYDIKNLSDVYSAIHAVQEELGVTGTTAIEASSTISGSLASMKAAFSNVLGNLALGRDIGPSLNALAETTTVFLRDNLAPAAGNILKAIPGAAFAFMKAMIPADLSSVVATGLTSLTEAVQTGLPAILSEGTAIVSQISQGFTAGLPGFLETAGSLLGGLSTSITGTLPTILDGGCSIVMSLADGLMTSAPVFLKSAGSLLSGLLDAAMKAAPRMLESGASLIVHLATGLTNKLPNVLSAAADIATNLLSTFASNLPGMLQSGASLILNLASGLISNLPQVISSGASIAADLLSTLASYLPGMIAQGVSMIGSLASGLISMIPDAVSAVGTIGSNLLSTLAGLLPSMLEHGVAMINNLVSGLISVGADVFSTASDLASKAMNAFSNIDWASVGSNLINGIVSGIKSAAGAVFSAMKSIAENALSSAKRALQIHSPSRRAEKEVGYQIPAGEANGIIKGVPLVKRAVQKMSDESMPRVADALRIRPAPAVPAGAPPQADSRCVNIVQNIYSQAKTAADLMIEARYQAETEVLMGA